jgi:predicted amidohydrolase/ribosomal protein S18 acetylase RimI-like enzyme
MPGSVIEGMDVRNASPEDLDALARLWHEVWRETHLPLMPETLVRLRTLDSFRERLGAGLRAVRVVGPPGAPLGFCWIKDDELYQLFVAAASRGGGAAAALSDDAEERLRAAGIATAWLACAIGNDRAARFYEKRGWIRTGVVNNPVETSEGLFPLDVWRYEKDLRRSAHDGQTTVRIALANLRYPSSPDESVVLAIRAIDEAAAQGALLVCFPECFVPGYRRAGGGYRRAGAIVPPPDAEFLDRAWSRIAEAAERGRIAVVLGTERAVGGGAVASVLVVNPDGSFAGFQDKVQIDPSEEGTYTPGSGRRVFRVGPLTFGVAICHEGWRYPETVRFAARHGAQVVFHPHFHEAEPGSYRPTTFADPANTFHEKAALCRAAENTCYFATVNCASEGSPSTSAIIRPDGTAQKYQPYGAEGVLVDDLDLTAATRLLASRLRSVV